MADIADQADDLIQAEVEEGIKAAVEGRAGPFAHLRPRGHCHWCHEAVPQGRLHCLPAENSCAEDNLQYLRFRGRKIQ